MLIIHKTPPVTSFILINSLMSDYIHVWETTGINGCMVVLSKAPPRSVPYWLWRNSNTISADCITQMVCSIFATVGIKGFQYWMY